MSVNNLEFLNVAGYKFEPLENLDSLIPEFQNKCDELGLKGSVSQSKWNKLLNCWNRKKYRHLYRIYGRGFKI